MGERLIKILLGVLVCLWLVLMITGSVVSHRLEAIRQDLDSVRAEVEKLDGQVRHELATLPAIH